MRKTKYELILKILINENKKNTQAWSRNIKSINKIMKKQL